MRVSIVIPVWNGASVIADCLKAVYASTGDELADVICVDNASEDESADCIATHYPQARLLRQLVNLGFAGGVNAGIAAASGDVLVLLNQDCLPEAGWLKAVLNVFSQYSNTGIVGCTIFHTDGTLDHAGAKMIRPRAMGTHLNDVIDAPRPADYVTGSAFGIHHKVIDRAGWLDEDFYPAYYEEADYCYRARHAGFEVMYAPKARVRHLRSSKEAHRAPIKHSANQHRMRFRFIIKHWSLEECIAFFAAERVAIANEPAVHQAIGCVLGARDSLRDLDAILAARERDLGNHIMPAHRRLLQARFTEMLRQAFARAEQLALSAPVDAIRGEGYGSKRVLAQLGALIGEGQLSRRLALLEALVDYDYR